MNIVNQYLYNLGVSLSQLLSVLLGGHPDSSISTRSGRALKYYSQSDFLRVTSWQYKYFVFQCFIIDAIMYLPDGRQWDHCLRSIEEEAKAKEIWNWGG